MKQLHEMNRTQKLKQPEHYMEKLDITLEEALELIDFDKQEGSTKKFMNEETTAIVAVKAESKKVADNLKDKARKIAKKVILAKDDNVQFDNGVIRMDVEKELGQKIPHQTITAELTQLVKVGILKKEKAGTKMMYQKV